MSIAAFPVRIPPGWTLTTLGEICQEPAGGIQTGPFGSQLHASDYVADGTPVVMPQDINHRRISTQRIARVGAVQLSELAKHQMLAGDIVFSRRGDVARFAVVTSTERGWLCGTGCLRARISSQSVAPEFAAWFWSQGSIRAWLERSAQGATMPNLNTTILSALPLLLPSLAEQRRIAAILDKADGIRRKRREVVKLAGEFLKSAFLEMFGDPVGNPRGWQVVELEETFADSPQLGTLVPVDETGTVPVVRVGQLGQPAPAWSSCGLVNIDRKEFERYELKPNDLLMARAIGSLDHLGKASIVGVDDPPAVFDSHVMRLRFNQDLLASGYFHTLLLTPGGRTRFLAQAARTAVQFNISGGKIARMKIPLPPSELQARFVALRDRTLALASGLRDAEVTAGQLFDSLVERAFEGGL